MNVQDKINKLSDDIVKLTTTSALDIIELMKSGQKDKVDKIVAF